MNEAGNKIGWNEIQKHNHRFSCWVVIHGKVYNLTNFINDVRSSASYHTDHV